MKKVNLLNLSRPALVKLAKSRGVEPVGVKSIANMRTAALIAAIQAKLDEKLASVPTEPVAEAPAAPAVEVAAAAEVEAAPAVEVTATAVIDIPETPAADAPPDNVVAFDTAAPVQQEIPTPAAPEVASSGLFKVSRKIFQKQLAAASKLIPSNPSMPVLGTVLIGFGENRVTVEATNLDAWVGTEVSAQTTGGYRLAVPFKLLSKFVAKCSSDFLMAEVKGDVVHISDLENRTEINGIPAVEFPPMLPVNPEPLFDISGKQLIKAIGETIKAASDDASRYILNGVAIDLAKGNVPQVVATDGKRLMTSVLGATSLHQNVDAIIIPTLSANVLRAGLPPDVIAKVTINSDRSRITVQSAAEGYGYTAAIRLASGQFPNYRQVIPKADEKRTVVTINREELLAALGRVTVLNSEKDSSIKLNFSKGALNVSVINESAGQGKEDVKTSGDTGSALVGVNPEYIKDVADSVSDERLTISVGSGPILITAEGVLAAVMPVRLE